jgi:phosphomannomutase/phosphoglucomutase
LYAGCRLLEILASRGESASEVFQQLPNSVSTPELKVPMQEGEHYRFVEKFRARARFDGARVTTIDGVRADWEDGWGLVRCSNTTPCLVLRFDANDDLALQRIKHVFKQQLLSVEAKLALPF